MNRNIFITKKVGVFFTVILIIGNMLTVCASAEFVNKVNHEDILKRFNEYYNTNYAFATIEDYSEDSPIYDDINSEISMINAMSDDEFWNYLYNLHTKTESDKDLFGNKSSVDMSFDNSNSINSVQSQIEQRHYYDSNANRYIAFYTECGYASGTYRYSSLSGVSSHVGNNNYNYARTITSYSYNIYNSGWNMKITYKYDLHMTAAIIYSSNNTATVTFKCGGADVWG